MRNFARAICTKCTHCKYLGWSSGVAWTYANAGGQTLDLKLICSWKALILEALLRDIHNCWVLRSSNWPESKSRRYDSLSPANHIHEVIVMKEGRKCSSRLIRTGRLFVCGSPSLLPPLSSVRYRPYLAIQLSATRGRILEWAARGAQQCHTAAPSTFQVEYLWPWTLLLFTLNNF